MVNRKADVKNGESAVDTMVNNLCCCFTGETPEWCADACFNGRNNHDDDLKSDVIIPRAVEQSDPEKTQFKRGFDYSSVKSLQDAQKRGTIQGQSRMSADMRPSQADWFSPKSSAAGSVTSALDMVHDFSESETESRISITIPDLQSPNSSRRDLGQPPRPKSAAARLSVESAGGQAVGAVSPSNVGSRRSSKWSSVLEFPNPQVESEIKFSRGGGPKGPGLQLVFFTLHQILQILFGLRSNSVQQNNQFEKSNYHADVNSTILNIHINDVNFESDSAPPMNSRLIPAKFGTRTQMKPRNYRPV